ncbi:MULTISPECIES: endo-1,4-beta-xylanase [Sphingobacterium]|uniref:Endo-1,4-beta-xylanase n=1 Tax=Sphingobacterium populi TaxID=1812824 RepID=A0ABW5UFJ5_9SPHI|nr:endo-1,4-beta-xylanase [Sphingobacterium sp. CFCC 11742]
MMNIITRLCTKVVIALIAALPFIGCVKYEARIFDVDKPQSIFDQEALDALVTLRSVTGTDPASHPTLGAEIALSAVGANHSLYRLMQEHMNEISITTSVYPVNVFNAEGSANLTALSQALELNSQTENPLKVHFGHLLWHENQFSTFLNSLIADIYIPGESGTDVVHDFEDDELGHSFPMIGSGSNAVVNDPNGETGKVLNIKGPQTFPQIRINLPEGRTVGDYKNVMIDFKGDGCCGYYGAGMRLGISAEAEDVNLGQYGSPASFGITINSWGRGLINLPLANLNLTSDQKAWTSFVLTIGSATGSADYYMDNIKMDWELEGQTIVKTPEERKTIFTTELEKWINATAEAGKDKVSSWSVAYQPIDDTDPSQLRSGVGRALPANTFYWQDYLGKDYAAIAIKQLLQQANSQDKFFITETNLLNNSAKLEALMDFIQHTEKQGAPIHGIVSELDLQLNSDKSHVENLFKSLAATNKLIKVAVRIQTGNTVQQTTNAQYTEQENMYKWLVQSYMEHIPRERRAGILFTSPTDAANQTVASGLWTNNAGYQRKPAYRGVLEALQNQ